MIKFSIQLHIRLKLFIVNLQIHEYPLISTKHGAVNTLKIVRVSKILRPILEILYGNVNYGINVFTPSRYDQIRLPSDSHLIHVHPLHLWATVTDEDLEHHRPTRLSASGWITLHWRRRNKTAFEMLLLSNAQCWWWRS